MPIYTYRCDDKTCGYEFDDLRDAKDREAPEACPICERGFVRLVLSTIARTPKKWGDTEGKGRL